MKDPDSRTPRKSMDLTRRSTMFGGFTTAAAGLAATIASNIALPLQAGAYTRSLQSST
jgi:hypothetical protein